jgi:hypothetical protein
LHSIEKNVLILAWEDNRTTLWGRVFHFSSSPQFSQWNRALPYVEAETYHNLTTIVWVAVCWNNTSSPTRSKKYWWLYRLSLIHQAMWQNWMANLKAHYSSCKLCHGMCKWRESIYCLIDMTCIGINYQLLESNLARWAIEIHMIVLTGA